ncbi:hypothetical protein HEK616_40910 [Streptomyces nigrescens]|uniref:SH3b domain-containing protein n=1 Tax=Streptomyces nigrescens TaxID=1920 RepID=A0ABN6QWP9_STRNI|nr:hypothetical protein HEK616_40910 [Streptomyces nigrescens]
MTIQRRLADAVSRSATNAVTQQAAAWLLATVNAVNVDGTVDVLTATGPVSSVRRLRSYASPVVGDVVRVDRKADGNWLVVDALSTGAGGWLALTMSSGFSANGGTNDPPPAARRTADGSLQLSGVVKGAATAGVAIQFATLPASLTPTYWVRGTVQTSSVGQLAGIDVSPAGVCRLLPVANHSATGWFQLDGVQGRYR